MSLRDRLEKAENRRSGFRCAVCGILQGMTAEDRQALEEALASEMYGSLIAQALRDEGYSIADQTLNRHRRGRCVGL